MTVREMIERIDKIDDLLGMLQKVSREKEDFAKVVEIPADSVGYLIFYLGFLKDKYLNSNVN